VLDPHNVDVGSARLVDQGGDIGDDGVAPFWTSITSSAVFGRFSSVVTVPPCVGLI
jgi:hypothetical protein